MAEAKVLYWHGIPTQVRAEDEDGRVGVQLAQRFQLAIDEAAMAANLVGDDEYTEGFYWGDPEERAGSAQKVAEVIAAEIEEQYPTIAWKDVVKQIKLMRARKRGKS